MRYFVHKENPYKQNIFKGGGFHRIISSCYPAEAICDLRIAVVLFFGRFFHGKRFEILFRIVAFEIAAEEIKRGIGGRGGDSERVNQKAVAFFEFAFCQQYISRACFLFHFRSLQRVQNVARLADVLGNGAEVLFLFECRAVAQERALCCGDVQFFDCL